MAIETLKERIRGKTWKRRLGRCWPWLGHIDSDGNARIWVDDTIGSICVPHAIFLAEGIEIPEGMVALGCPILGDCVNPDHISVGTKEDVGDRILFKKRQQRKKQREQNDTQRSFEEMK